MAESQTKGQTAVPIDPKTFYISVRRSNKQYIYQIKNRLREQETLQLHGLGDAMTNVIQIAEALQRFGYVQIQKIETLTIDLKTQDNRIAKKAKLIVTLTRSKDFEGLFTKYEETAKFENLLPPQQ